MAQVKTRNLDIKEAVEIIKAIKGDDVKVALYMEMTLGLRISDIFKINLEQLSKGRVVVTEEKTGKQNDRDIDEKILINILKLAPQWKGFKGNLESFSRKAQRQIKKACEELGIEGTNISTHSFRKTYATTVYEDSGNNIQLVKELLNHSSVATTQKYLGVSEREKKEFGTLKINI